MSGAVCIFAKVPRPGHVKTRLARAVGQDAAAQLAQAFLEDAVALARSLAGAHVFVAFDAPPPAFWRRPEVSTFRQCEGALGERIEHGLARALAGREWVMALGADSPGLPVAYLVEAVRALQTRERPSAVFGPTRDGGFYLLATRTMPERILRDVRWSSPDTLVDTEEAFARAGLTTARVTPWFDVDEPEDLDHLRLLLASGSILAPATLRALVALGLA